ncbi:hypothetical protein D9M71_246660 [compost metagenome]
MVPAGKPPIGRTRAAAVGFADAPAQHTDHRPKHRHERGRQRQVDQQIAPPAIHADATQRVQPVQPGADQVPAAFQRAGIADHCAGLPGDVQQGAVGIGKLYPLQRSVGIQRPGMAPEVFLHRPPINRCCQWIVLASGGQGPIAISEAHALARAGIHRDIAAARIAEQVARLTGHGAEANAGGGSLRIGCGQRDAQVDAAVLQAEHRQMAQVLSRCQLGIADIEHDHAREKPQGHEQTQADAQPAVPQVQVTFHRRRPRNVSARPVPGSAAHRGRACSNWSSARTPRRSGCAPGR